MAAPTTKFIGGSTSSVSQPFRAYSSMQQGVNDYVTLLPGHARYQQAHWAQGEDVHAFASALTRGGYATDPIFQKLVAMAASVRGTAQRDDRAVIQDAGRAADNGEWGILVSERTP